MNDILDAAELLREFTDGKTLDNYIGDIFLRSATERQFGIIGEAVSQLANIDEAIASQITEFQRIIAFRNVLIHRYRSVDHQVVWEILHHKLPALSLEVEYLLQEK